MTQYRFAGHPAAQAYVVRDGNNTNYALVSYTTTVAVVDDASWLTVRGLYSRTTIKHLSWFMKLLSQVYDVRLDYQLAKQLYTDGVRMNLLTGEIQSV